MRDHRRFPHRRPPWWPEEAPWPPNASLHRRRRHFFFRLVVFFLFVILLAGLGFITLISAVLQLVGVQGIPGNPLVIGLVALGLFLGLSFIAAGLRRLAMPISSLMEAADRVAQGDYNGRVEEHGTPEMRAIARAFNAMTERLQEQDQQRRDLLSDVTHELRTPLTVIQGNLEGLLDGVYPRDDPHLETILNETHLMSRLIDDLRTLTLAESGTLKLQKEPADLSFLIEETVDSFRIKADSMSVTLETRIDPSLPTIDVDTVRIREVLSNLIANALHYTPAHGRIEVDAAVEHFPTEQVVISVRDTGRGISPENLPHIFERFYKGRDSAGSGLGLAIAKNLVALHGGEITAESKVDQGTTIRFTLPAT